MKIPNNFPAIGLRQLRVSIRSIADWAADLLDIESDRRESNPHHQFGRSAQVNRLDQDLTWSVVLTCAYMQGHPEVTGLSRVGMREFPNKIPNKAHGFAERRRRGLSVACMSLHGQMP